MYEDLQPIKDSDLVRSLFPCHCPVIENCKGTDVFRGSFKNASKEIPKQYFLATTEQLRNVLL